MLDLANVVKRASKGFQTYERTWLEVTGQAVDNEQADLGFKWAALQLPIQYLPWTMAHVPSAQVDATLDRVERALLAL